MTFQLTLTFKVFSQLDQDTEGLHYSQMLSELLGAGHTDGLAELGVKTSEKQVPAEKLWQGIVQNLKKSLESKAAISVSHQELLSLCNKKVNSAHLSTEIVSNGNVASNDLKGPVVLFTCGHHYARNAFLEAVIPELDTALSGGSHTQTWALLRQFYHSEGFCPLACPRCVLRALLQQ